MVTEASKGRILVTGGAGFLGSWVVRRLVDSGYNVRSFDLRSNLENARDILHSRADTVEWFSGDVGNADDVGSAMDGCTAIVHIAGLLTPACRADPRRGAHVNLIGSLNVFEAAKRLGIGKVVYASTAAVFGPADNQAPHPVSLYGAFKLAVEGCARAYWLDHGIPSIGLRPLVIYGPGRELGPTAGVTLACRAALRGESYNISFTGRTGFMHVEEVASVFENALRATQSDALVYNCWGDDADVADVIEAIRSVVHGARIDAQGPTTGVPADIDSSALYNAFPTVERIPLKQGIKRTIDYYASKAKII